MHAAADIEQAACHGVSVETVAELRITALTEGLHYAVATGSLAYTAEGERALASLLSAEPPPPKKEGGRSRGKAQPSGNAPSSPSSPQQAALTVLRLYPNPLFVQVRTPDGGEADLHIRPHASLTVGTAIECELIDGQWLCTQPGLIPRLRP